MYVRVIFDVENLEPEDRRIDSFKLEVICQKNFFKGHVSKLSCKIIREIEIFPARAPSTLSEELESGKRKKIFRMLKIFDLIKGVSVFNFDLIYQWRIFSN
jgi:hypothetical protein